MINLIEKKLKTSLDKLLWIIALSLISNIASANLADFYSEPGISPFRDYTAPNDYQKIDPFTGKTQLQNTDVFIPGNGGLNLEIKRTYTSSNSWSNPWRMHLGRVFRNNVTTPICTGGNVSNKDNPVLELSDGSQQILSDSYASGYVFVTLQFWKASCATNGNGLIVTSPVGTVYEMTYKGSSNEWYATKITDRNGNWISATYVNNNANGVKLASVTTSDSRTLTFNNTVDANGYTKLSSISDGTRTWQYTYITGYAVGDYLLSQVTLPNGTTWKYTYNGNNGTNAGSYQLSGVTNPFGGVINYTYGFTSFNQSAGYTADVVATSSTAVGVGTWNYAYTPSTGSGVMDITTVTAPSGLPTTIYKHFGYNSGASIGDLWRVGLLYEKRTGTTRVETYTWSPLIASSQNNARVFAWDTKIDNDFNVPVLTNKTVAQNGVNYSTSYSNFDAYANPGTVTESGVNGGGRTTTYTYNVNTTKWIINQLKNETVTGGVAITRAFDANGNLTSQSKDGVTTTFTYDAQGNLASSTLPGSRLYTYSNYYRGVARTESQPEGINITRTVDNAGNTASITNGNGKTTSYLFDGMNRVTKVTYPAGNPVNISYGVNSQTTTRGSLTESVAINTFGYATSVNLGGITQSYGYDGLWRKTFESSPNSTTSGTWFAYDEINRVYRVTNADGSQKNTTYGVGAMTVTDENNKATTYTYRAYGDPTKTLLMSTSAPVAQGNITIARNSRDLITSVVQNGFTRTYAYNANFYLSSITNPETGVTTYGRDTAGNMTSRTVGASGTTTFAYDGKNRLISSTYPGIATPTTLTYNKTGKITSVTSADASKSLAYDSNDNLVTEGLVVDGLNFSTTYGYNANDQLSSITYPYSNRTVSYSPDVLGRPTVVSGYVSSIAYWPSGQINVINYGNGVKSTYGQNSRLWPSSFATQLGTSTPYINNSYGYDYVGNLLSVSDTVNATYSRTFTYDGINRLLGASGPWGSGSIAYSGDDNILSQTFGTANITYGYDSQNRLSTVTGNLRNANYSYDVYGNIVDDGAGKSFSYDDIPNLVCFNCTDPTTKISYTYDGLNKRVSVTKNGNKTYEFYGSDGKLLIEYTPSQLNKLVEYIYLGGKRVAQRVTTQ